MLNCHEQWSLKTYSLDFCSNLAPRVLRLFGQWLVARTDFSDLHNKKNIFFVDCLPRNGSELFYRRNPAVKKSPGARFSKVPVTSGPDNLSGPLSGNFIGSDVAFLEAPVNFAGNFRAR